MKRFSEGNQFALEVIRIRKLINFTIVEDGERMSSIIHTFLIISLIYLARKKRERESEVAREME